MPLILIALCAALGLFWYEERNVHEPVVVTIVQSPPPVTVQTGDWTSRCKHRLEAQRDAEAADDFARLARGKVEIFNAGDSDHPIPFVEYTLLGADGGELYQVSVTKDSNAEAGHDGHGCHCRWAQQHQNAHRWFEVPDRGAPAGRTQRELYGKGNGRLARLYADSGDATANRFIADFHGVVDACLDE